MSGHAPSRPQLLAQLARARLLPEKGLVRPHLGQLWAQEVTQERVPSRQHHVDGCGHVHIGSCLSPYALDIRQAGRQVGYCMYVSQPPVLQFWMGGGCKV